MVKIIGCQGGCVLSYVVVAERNKIGDFSGASEYERMINICFISRRLASGVDVGRQS